MSKKQHSFIRSFITQCLVWGGISLAVLAGFWTCTPRPKDPQGEELAKAEITRFDLEDFKPKTEKNEQTKWGTPQTAEPQRIHTQNGNTIGFGRLSEAPLWVACTNFKENPELKIEDARGAITDPNYKLEKLTPSIQTSRGVVPMAEPLKKELKTWTSSIQEKGFTHIITGPIYSDKITIIANYPLPDAVYGIAMKDNGGTNPTIESVLIYPNNKGAKTTPIPYPELVKITGILFFIEGK